MYNLHFIPNNIFTNFFKELTKYKNDYQQYLNYICRVTNRSPSPQELGYEPNEPNTINLQREGERTWLLTD